MRSKQQPRPSYRWLNKEENDENAERNAESPENNPLTRSGSTSPETSSIHSSEFTQNASGDAANTQFLPPPLMIVAAAAITSSKKTDLAQQPDSDSLTSVMNSVTKPILSPATTSSTLSPTAALASLSTLLSSSSLTSTVNASNFPNPSPTSVSLFKQKDIPSPSPSPSALGVSLQQGQRERTRHDSVSPTSHRSDAKIEDARSDTANSPAEDVNDSGAERELASPRCQSRDSSSGGRCPSDDSNYSGNGSTTAPTASSPVGITLPATLPPAAAAALLPPQSAAMAAYLNVAAAAAQQNRLLLSNPLAAAAGLVRAAQSSPPTLPPLTASSSPIPDDAPILDFSTKRTRRDSEDTDSKSESDAVNLSKSDNGPLDLSVGSRKRSSENESVVPSPQHRKVPRAADYKQTVVSPWTSPITPYFAAAVAAASLSPKNPHPVDWNGKNKMSVNDATKALEKMSEMTRLGGTVGVPGTAGANVGCVGGDNAAHELGVRPPNNQQSSSGGRHSAWQSHWLNKGADAVKDVFKCVWCKQSFPTLATLTTHMKETQHCGVNVPPSGNMPATSGQPPHHHQSHLQHPPQSGGNQNPGNKSDLNLLIKETMPLPRKLVRGQDVWLGKGAEQTRQILKCMWCGQSFRSLAEMTSHMQQTQHYTNIISQEQIISWKSSEDGKGGGPGGSNGGGGSASNAGSGANSTVSAVLTCKVCDQAFSSLKDLSNHMVKNAHYKEHIMRSITESGGRRRQTREKRKKSLPVRKLLELERAQHEFKNGDIKPLRDIGSTRITCEKCGDKIETALFVEHIRQCVGGSIPSSPRSGSGMLKSSLSANSIIPPDSMGPLTPNSRDGRKSIGDESTSPASNRHISPLAPDVASPSPKEGLLANNGAGSLGSNVNNSSTSGEKMSSPSVLNAIEQLIEKSFDTRSRHGTPGFSTNSHSSAPLGSSILKRLGIDESVDYTKPLIDPQTMNLLRTYQQHSQYMKRERSGSESSSVSDRGSSRLESLTPERKPEHSNHATPRQSPEKLTPSVVSTSTSQSGAHNYSHDHRDEENKEGLIHVKTEPADDSDATENTESEAGTSTTGGGSAENLHIKKECNEDGSQNRDHNEGELDLSSKRKTNEPPSPSASPHQPTGNAAAGASSSSYIAATPVMSPSSSDRSITPRSNANSSLMDKKLPSGSLTALSSMFDSLTGSSSATAGGSSETSSSGMSSNKKGSSHPLAALQKLCDKTENNAPNTRSSSSNALSSSVPTIGGAGSGSMLAFSWACNDAVMTSDSIIKCAFCDTPFCSKGAYRHHLSKVHFVKDDVIIDPIAIKNDRSGSAGSNSTSLNLSHFGGSAGNGANSNNSQPKQLSSSGHPPPSSSQSPKDSISSMSSTKSPSPSHPQAQSQSTANSASSSGGNPIGGNSSAAPSGSGPFEESPHSKFLKYTELAKQLSSKYV